MRSLVLPLFSLLLLFFVSPCSHAAVTLPDEPIEEHPVDIVLPRDFPLPKTDKTIEAEGLKILWGAATGY
jgi:hypothetical protein